MGLMNAILKANRVSVLDEQIVYNSLYFNKVLADLIDSIGRDLDQGIYPLVQDRGIVTPGFPSDPLLTSGEEYDHAGKRSSSSASTTSSRASAPTRSPGAAAPIERPNIQEIYLNEIDSIRGAYPDCRVWHQDDGMWLHCTSGILNGLAKSATFLLAVNWTIPAVRAWGFWRDSVVSVQWIGPRHTNFPDGSICAFDPIDGTWVIGNPLITLLDLYTVWVFRHLHLESLGRWPGSQSVALAFERRNEFTSNEQCGCGSNTIYRECCSIKDSSRKPLDDFISFAMATMGGSRSPPKSVVQAALGCGPPPPIGTIRWR